MKLDKVFPDVPEVFHNRVLQALDSQDDTVVERMKSSMKITKKMITIAVAAILICSLSLGAYALIMWNPKFADLFNANDEQQQNMIDNSTTVVLGQAAEDNGVTIEAVQMIGDKRSAYILLCITGPEDIFATEINFGELEVTIGELSSKYDGFYYMSTSCPDDVETQGDKNQQYLELMIVDERIGDLMGETITVKIHNLADYETQVAAGAWELSWPMNIEDHTEILTVNETLEFDGNQATIESIELSPVSISFDLGGDGVNELVEAMDDNENPLRISFSLIMEKGTVFEGVGFPGIQDWNENTEGVYSIFRSFSNVLDIEKVVAISITCSDGVVSEVVEIPVEHE